MFSFTQFNTQTQPKQKKTGEQVYFQGNRKNQLNDIHNFMKSLVSDPQREHIRKQMIKKVIVLTTSGMDTSRLYPEIVMASATRDTVEKKLIYMYLSIYSSHNANFARMAINTFMKDAYSPNPNSRSLAIRHLSNLRFKGREEYVYPILKAGLQDYSPLVKKSCVMGITKLIIQKRKTEEEPERDQQILNIFYDMIRDTDPYLVCTAIQAINQIQPDGIAMSKKLANYLLTNISNFNEYQLPSILRYLQLYDPKTDEEIHNTLSVLHPKLKSSSLSVTLAISKIYLKMSKLKPDVQKEVMDSIKHSMMSFLNHECPQIQFVMLKHIQYLIEGSGSRFAKDMFVADVKKFIPGGNEPTYLRVIKIKIMELCVRKTNLADVVNELAEGLLDESVVKDVIAAFSKMLGDIQDDNDSKFIIKTIIKTIDSAPTDSLCNSALPLIRNYLRKYPNDFSLFAGIFYRLVQHANEDEARCAMVELIGDYGEDIEDAIELITWSETGISDALKVSLMRANIKLFFKRPDEMLNVISHMFKNIFRDDECHLQIKDYAAFLYRGLQSDLPTFQKLFLQSYKHDKLVDLPSEELEFNTLQIMYHAKQEKWIIQKNKYVQDSQEVAYDQSQAEAAKEESQQQERNQLQLRKRKSDINVDSKFKHLQVQNFDVTFTMSSQQFEAAWQNYQIGSSITRIVTNIEQLSEDMMEELFKIWNIQMMASAQNESQIKLYLYCKVFEVTGDLGIACMQLCILKEAQTMTLMIKSDNEELAGFVSRYVEQFLIINSII